MGNQLKEKYQDNIVDNTSSDTVFDKTEQRSLEIKVGQNEIKIEALSERIISTLKIKKWIFASILTILALILGAGVFLSNLLFSYNQHIFEIQNNNYKQIIEIKEDINNKYYLNSIQMNNNFNKIENQEEILNCLQNKKYWQFEECLK